LTSLTPVDTRYQGLLGAAGVTGNAKTLDFSEGFHFWMLYESGALPLSYIGGRRTSGF
jgi:hypothetical protein